VPPGDSASSAESWKQPLRAKGRAIPRGPHFSKGSPLMMRTCEIKKPDSDLQAKILEPG
jgi:hypothetical protein